MQQQVQGPLLFKLKFLYFSNININNINSWLLQSSIFVDILIFHYLLSLPSIFLLQSCYYLFFFQVMPNIFLLQVACIQTTYLYNQLESMSKRQLVALKWHILLLLFIKTLIQNENRSTSKNSDKQQIYAQLQYKDMILFS